MSSSLTFGCGNLYRPPRVMALPPRDSSSPFEADWNSIVAIVVILLVSCIAVSLKLSGHSPAHPLQLQCTVRHLVVAGISSTPAPLDQ